MTPLAQPARSIPADTEAEEPIAAHSAARFASCIHKNPVIELTPHAGPTVFHEVPAPVFTIDGPGTVALEGTGVAAAGSSLSVLLQDALELFKVKVVILVVVTAWGGYHLGALRASAMPAATELLSALLGIGWVSAGAGALNEVLERKTDARMRRTANRPLAANRVSLAQGIVAGVGAVLMGALWLLWTSNPLTMALALLTALLYTLVYTPLKQRTRWATFIGAFPGAMGPVLGWTAARGRIEWQAVALFAILFVWQFPHFMSIAWLYRADYERAGIRMLPVVQPDGVSTVVVALLHAVLMIPVSLVPVLLGMTSAAYTAVASVLGLLYLAYTIRFARILKPAAKAESVRVARELLRVSVLYLPLLFAALMLCANQVR